jgi:hypothetical protein
VGDPVLLDQLGELHRVECRRDHRAAALQQDGVQAGRPTRVEEVGDVLQVGIALPHVQLDGERHHRRDGVAVGEDRALRHAGRAAGRPQHVGVVVGEFDAGVGLVGRGQKGLEVQFPTVVTAESDDVLDGRDVGQPLVGGVDEIRVDEQRGGLHVAEV